MRCPFCMTMDNRVIDSRDARDGRAIRRRRVCSHCDERFTTYEAVEETIAEVLKRDDRTEPFDRNKLVKSMRLACKKRPVNLQTLTEFVESLEAHVATRPRKQIRSNALGEQVLNFLRDLDAVAYVRYASVYRSFNNVAEFMNELEKLQSENTEG